MTAEDLTLYAMGLLDVTETVRVETLLRNSPEAVRELAELRGDLAMLALTTEQQMPPASARQRLMAQIAREPRADAEAVPAPEAAFSEDRFIPASRPAEAAPPAPLVFRSPVKVEPRRGLLAAVLPWAGWAIAATLAVASFSLYRDTDDLHQRLSAQMAATRGATARAARAQTVLDVLRSSESQRFLLTRADAPPVMQARVTYLAQTGSLVFQGSHLDALPVAKTYELWLIPAAQGLQPIPAGTFRPDERGDASVILPELPKGIIAGKFGVTMEDDGGATAPTAPILMIGQ